MSELESVVARYWGYTSFRPLQREAMAAVLADRDSLVVLPTGGGKSLCFQAPAVVRQGLAVVVSPLISLMKDQVDALVGNGVPAGLYNSSLASEEKAAVLSGLRQGRYRTAFCPSSRHAQSASWPLTRPTASVSGVMTSGQNIAGSDGCARSCPVSAFTHTPPPPPRACAGTLPRNSG